MFNLLQFNQLPFNGNALYGVLVISAIAVLLGGNEQYATVNIGEDITVIEPNENITVL